MNEFEIFLEFKTPKNQYGHREYLAFDIKHKTYSTFPNSVIVDGIEIKKKDMQSILKTLKENGYTDVYNGWNCIQNGV